MLEIADWKLIAGSIALSITVASYFPYWVEIFRGNTKPHLYTWLIWLISQIVALAGMLYGGGGHGTFALWAGLFGVGSVFLLCFRYGTKNIMRSDIVVLLLALIAVALLVVFDNPLLAVILVSLIDALGYIPTIRKLYQEPWTESLLSWSIVTIAHLFSFMALAHYNALTLTYLITVFFANIILLSIGLIRRTQLATR